MSIDQTPLIAKSKRQRHHDKFRVAERAKENGVWPMFGPLKNQKIKKNEILRRKQNQKRKLDLDSPPQDSLPTSGIGSPP